MELLTEEEDYLVRMHRMCCTHKLRREYSCKVGVFSHHGNVFYSFSIWHERLGTYIANQSMIPSAREAFELLYEKLKSLKLL